MTTITKFRRWIFAALLAVGSLGGATAAQAHDYGYAPSCGYHWVTTYETRDVPYTKCFTHYDCYGQPYTVTKTFYATEQYAVRHWVKYCY